MTLRAVPVVTTVFLCLFLSAAPVLANGETVITQAKALAGNVTPGDTPGFPVTLSQPGAYVVESNLAVTPGTVGLSVTSDNVDIDMNGFTLSGGGAATYGVMTSFGESRIHNGVINSFKNSGIFIYSQVWIIKDMQIIGNGEYGIYADFSTYITIANSVVSANGKAGIQTRYESVIRNNTISDNASNGVRCVDVCLISGNLVDNNGNHGIASGLGFTNNNTIMRNKGYGIYNLEKSGIANNMLFNNNVRNAPLGAGQVLNVIDVHPNKCVGLPC